MSGEHRDDGSGASSRSAPGSEPAGHDDGGHGGHPLGHLRDDLEAAAIQAEFDTGRREESVEQARRHVFRRLARMTGGTVLCVIGLTLMVLPGPGMVVLASGLVLLAVDVPWAARLLERVKKRLPEGEDGKVSRRFIAGSVAVAVVTMGASIWWTFVRN